jgi:hypothetical protein
MPDKGTSPKTKELSRGTAPRSNLTPSGFKNVRVFVPKALWYQLVSHSAASEMSLQDYVVAVLERATPLTLQSSCQRQMAMEQAPGHLPGQRPPSAQDKAERPGAAHPPEAEAASSHDPAPDQAPSRSSTTQSQAGSPAVHDLDSAEAGRTTAR